MGKIIKYEISDDDVAKLKKVYDISKAKLPASVDSFDEFLNWTINIAIKTHIQLASINDKMMDFLSDATANFNDAEFGDISKFVNSIFDKETNKKHADQQDVNKSKNISKKN